MISKLLKKRIRFRLLLSVLMLSAAGCGGGKHEPCTGGNCPNSNSAKSDNSKDATNRSAFHKMEDASEKLSMRVVEAPDWISSGGNSASYPTDRYLTGIAAAQGDDALNRAMTEAAANLANRISVRIEHELSDYSAERNGEVDYHVAAVTKLTSDVRIQGLQYEIAYRGAEVFALAYINRSDAATERKLLLDKTLLLLRSCIDSARAKNMTDSVGAGESYLKCVSYVAEGLQHDITIRTVDPKGGDTKPQHELVRYLREIREETSSTSLGKASSIKEAADYLGLQLGAGGVLSYDLREVPPFSYGATNFVSSLGRQIADYLNNAIARQKNSDTSPISSKGKAVVHGVYFEEGDNLRFSATLVEVSTGRPLIGAETLLPKSNLPPDVSIVPANLEGAMADQRILGKGELLDGTLRLEVWADKGRRSAVYTESEEIKIFMRVNAPAYVRLIYVLENGAKVPIDQAYYIDASKVNLAVQYPDTFEVVPPFGIEHIHAAAFTKSPEPLPVTTRIISGVKYDVIEDGLSSMVRHRGIKRKEKDEVAESLLSISTLPSSSLSEH